MQDRRAKFYSSRLKKNLLEDFILSNEKFKPLIQALGTFKANVKYIYVHQNECKWTVVFFRRTEMR